MATFALSNVSFEQVVFAKVNTEEEPELAGHFEIRSIPTLMVFREKVILFSQPGALPASGLEAVIKKVQEIDRAEVHRDIAARKVEVNVSRRPADKFPTPPKRIAGSLCRADDRGTT